MYRRTTAILCLIVVGCTSVAFADGGKGKKKRICVEVSYAAFIPSDGDTRSNFDEVWSSIGVGRFIPERPNHWAFDWDVTWLDEQGVSDADLIPLTAGVQRGLGIHRDRQPYVTVRVGPYYGDVDHNTKGPDATKIGLNANASLGVILKQKYFLEARYDLFSRLAGNNFNGFTFTGGVKVLEFSL